MEPDKGAGEGPGQGSRWAKEAEGRAGQVARLPHRNNTLSFVPGLRGRPAGARSFGARNTRCGGRGRVGDGTGRDVMAQGGMCRPAREGKQAAWGCYVKKQALPLAKLGPARAGRERLMGSCLPLPKPLELPSKSLGTAGGAVL